MSKFKHQPFIEEWFTARDDNGQIVEDDGYMASTDHEIGHSEVEDTQRPNTIYRAMVLWEPWRRAYWDDELETVRTNDLPAYGDGQVAKIKRLQTAVSLMIEDIQGYEFEKNLNRPRPEALPFIEDYGVTAEDMW